jgi:hypothetical protein
MEMRVAVRRRADARGGCETYVGETTRTLARPCGWTCERESLGLWSRVAYGGVRPLVKTAVSKRSRKMELVFG